MAYPGTTSNPPSAPHVSQEAGAYPGPLSELNFWTERAANLNSVHEQLTGDKIQKVVRVLELAKSTYFPAFQRLFQEVRGAGGWGQEGRGQSSPP